MKNPSRATQKTFQLIAAVLLALTGIAWMLFTARAERQAQIDPSGTAPADATSSTPALPPIVVPDPSITISTTAAAPGLLATETSSFTTEPSDTVTPTLTASVTPTATPGPTQVFLPAVIRPGLPVPSVKTLICASPSIPIPDNHAEGISHILSSTDTRVITDLDIRLNINHTMVGDISVRLEHQPSGKSITLINRPGHPASTYGCTVNHITAILDDEMSWSAEDKCLAVPPAIAGSFIPDEPLNTFDGDLLAGQWKLTVIDNAQYDTGSLTSWCIFASVSPDPAQPTPTPEIPTLPNQRILSGITGQPQKYNLDCETRSAIDWARYFGVVIGEDQFFNGLPSTDNPDTGFVGDVNGVWGQIPPDDYGVHAQPIAARLRHYGLQATARRYMSWGELKSEIAAGRPVIVWVIGALRYGIPEIYTPSDGLHTVVAAYEHTLVATGYTQTSIYLLNGGVIAPYPIEKFLDSWSVLGNMAVIAAP